MVLVNYGILSPYPRVQRRCYQYIGVRFRKPVSKMWDFSRFYTHIFQCADIIKFISDSSQRWWVFQWKTNSINRYKYPINSSYKWKNRKKYTAHRQLRMCHSSRTQAGYPSQITSVLTANETSSTLFLLPSWREGVVSLCDPHHTDSMWLWHSPRTQVESFLDPEHAHWTRHNTRDAYSKILVVWFRSGTSEPSTCFFSLFKLHSTRWPTTRGRQPLR